jgi:hypothetical protein
MPTENVERSPQCIQTSSWQIHNMFGRTHKHKLNTHFTGPNICIEYNNVFQRMWILIHAKIWTVKLPAKDARENNKAKVNAHAATGACVAYRVSCRHWATSEGKREPTAQWIRQTGSAVLNEALGFGGHRSSWTHRFCIKFHHYPINIQECRICSGKKSICMHLSLYFLYVLILYI